LLPALLTAPSPRKPCYILELPLHALAASLRSPRAAAAADLQRKGTEREGEGRGAWKGKLGRKGDLGKRRKEMSSGERRERSRENKKERIRISTTLSPSGHHHRFVL